jgi:hypothetical protein
VFSAAYTCRQTSRFEELEELQVKHDHDKTLLLTVMLLLNYEK